MATPYTTRTQPYCYAVVSVLILITNEVGMRTHAYDTGDHGYGNEPWLDEDIEAICAENSVSSFFLLELSMFKLLLSVTRGLAELTS